MSEYPQAMTHIILYVVDVHSSICCIGGLSFEWNNIN